jgi:SAM-dependent methyltransferase
MRKIKLIYRVSYLYGTAIIKRLKKKIGFITTNSGTAHSHMSIDQSIDYIKNVFNDYKSISGIEKFYGKIAEVGPGDSNGVAFLMISDGADSVDLVDKYYSSRDEKHEEDVLCRLSSRSFKHKIKKAKRHYGNEASAESFFQNNNRYDFIVSRAVLEHVDAPLFSIQSMYNSLNRGGMLIHKVDLRDHGMFSEYKLHDLTFLTIPKKLYKLFTHNTGRPNRVMADEYISFIEKNFSNYTIYVTSLSGKGELEVDQYFDLKNLNYKNLTKSDLYIQELFNNHIAGDLGLKSIRYIVNGIFLVIRKE